MKENLPSACGKGAGPARESAGQLSTLLTWQVCAGAVRGDGANLLSTKWE